MSILLCTESTVKSQMCTLHNCTVPTTGLPVGTYLTIDGYVKCKIYVKFQCKVKCKFDRPFYRKITNPGAARRWQGTGGWLLAVDCYMPIGIAVVASAYTLCIQISVVRVWVKPPGPRGARSAHVQSAARAACHWTRQGTIEADVYWKSSSCSSS